MQKLASGQCQLVNYANYSNSPAILLIRIPLSNLVLNASFCLAAVNSTKHNRLSNGLYIKNVSQADAGEYTCRALRITPTFSDAEQITILLRIQRKCNEYHLFALFNVCHVCWSVSRIAGPCKDVPHLIIFNLEFISHPTCWQLHSPCRLCLSSRLFPFDGWKLSWDFATKSFADGSLKLFSPRPPGTDWTCFVGFNEIFKELQGATFQLKLSPWHWEGNSCRMSGSSGWEMQIIDANFLMNILLDSRLWGLWFPKNGDWLRMDYTGNWLQFWV